jgi:hypothetical protein
MDPKVKLAKKKSATPSRFDERNEDTFGIDPSGGSGATDSNGWSVQDMFAVNSRLTGQTYSYDGNPHNFGDRHPQYVKYSSASPSCVFSPSTALERGASTEHPSSTSSISRSIFQPSSSSSSLPKPPFSISTSGSGDSSNHTLISKTHSLFSQMNSASPPSPPLDSSDKTRPSQYFPSPFVFETQKVLRQLDSALGIATPAVVAGGGKRGRGRASERAE